MLSVSATKRCSSPTPSMSMSDASAASSSSTTTAASCAARPVGSCGKAAMRPESSRQVAKDLLVKFTVLTIAVTAIASIVLAIAGVFSEQDGAEEEGSTVPCDGEPNDGSIAKEAAQSFLVFVLGFCSCFFMKKRHDLARRFDNFVGRATAVASVANTRVAAVVRFRPQWPSWLNQGVMSIVVSGLLCTGCVVYLFVSAFAAIPGIEPSDEGGTPDPSTKTKVFTIGWMVVLSFKLRRELVSLVGNGALFQPW